jgi:hypothetical protein
MPILPVARHLVGCAAALDMVLVFAWVDARPLATTRPSHFAASALRSKGFASSYLLGLRPATSDDYGLRSQLGFL